MCMCVCMCVCVCMYVCNESELLMRKNCSIEDLIQFYGCFIFETTIPTLAIFLCIRL